MLEALAIRTQADLDRWEPLCRGVVSRYYAPGHDREDLMQEAHLAVHDALRSYRGDRGSSLKTFVGMVVERRIATAVRSATRQKHRPLTFANRVAVGDDGEETDALDLVAAPPDSDPLQRLIERDRLDEVVRKLNEDLSPMERDAVVCVANGASYEEAATALEMSPKAIDTALTRARYKLRGVQPPSASKTYERKPRLEVVEPSPERRTMHSPELERALDAEVETLQTEIEDLERQLAGKRDHHGRVLAFRNGAKPDAPNEKVERPEREKRREPARTKPERPERNKGVKPPPNKRQGQRPDVDDMVDKVVEAVRAGATQGGQIRSATGISEGPPFKRTIDAAVTAGRIRKTGQRRATRYSLPEGNPVNPEPAPSEPTQSLPARRSSSTARAGQTSKRAAAALDVYRKIRNALEEAGPEGLTIDELVEAIGGRKPNIRGKLTQMVGKGQVASDSGIHEGPTRYRSVAHGVFPADADGCRTNLERRIVAAIKASPVPLTTNEVGSNAKVGSAVGSILAALGRRGAVTCIAARTENGRTRWAPASTSSAAEAA